MVPLSGRNVSEVLDLVRPLYVKHGFDFTTALMVGNARTVIALMSVFYDKEDPEETRRAEGRRQDLARLSLDAERRLATLPLPADDLAPLDAELTAIDRDREAAVLERDALRLAHRTLLGCKDEFIKVASTRLAAAVSEVFADLTGGRYRTVRVDPASLELSVDGPERVDVAAVHEVLNGD